VLTEEQISRAAQGIYATDFGNGSGKETLVTWSTAPVSENGSHLPIAPGTRPFRLRFLGQAALRSRISVSIWNTVITSLVYETCLSVQIYQSDKSDLI
jgi:hypothetical protein